MGRFTGTARVKRARRSLVCCSPMSVPTLALVVLTIGAAPLTSTVCETCPACSATSIVAFWYTPQGDAESAGSVEAAFFCRKSRWREGGTGNVVLPPGRGGLAAATPVPTLVTAELLRNHGLFVSRTVPLRGPTCWALQGAPFPADPSLHWGEIRSRPATSDSQELAVVVTPFARGTRPAR